MSNIIQFQVDPALTETILTDIAGSNGPVDFERLCPLTPYLCSQEGEAVQ